MGGVLRHREGWGPCIERTLPEPHQEVSAGMWGTLVQTLALEPMIQSPQFLNVKKGSQSHWSLFILHISSWRTKRPFKVLKATWQHVTEQEYIPNPQASRTRIFLLQQSFPNFRHPKLPSWLLSFACIVDHLTNMGLLKHGFFSTNTVNVFSVFYNDFFSSLFYYMNIMYNTYKICVSQLSMLLVRLLVNIRLLAVKFWESQTLYVNFLYFFSYANFRLCVGESIPLTLMLFKSQLYYL